MGRYFTIMVVPERGSSVNSFRIPRIIFHTVIFMIMISIFLLAILSYDYWKILRQVYENKHLTIENRQLKEQIQLFQMKINTLAEDIERIHTFEKKLRIITGVDQADTSRGLDIGIGIKNHKEKNLLPEMKKEIKGFNFKKDSVFKPFKIPENFEKEPKYQKLANSYERKMAASFGLQAGYSYTKEWSELTKQSFSLAAQFAQFDYKFNIISKFVSNLETDINELDQHLLDKDSFLKSTPTLLPTRGWITSYYGPRKNPYSGRVKMHEGIDIGARVGTPVVAPADGIVTFSGKKPGYGILVKLDHGYGIETIFAHAQSANVKKGQKIKRGYILANVGNTGYSTGPHVHYEIRVNETPVDPLYFILD